MFEQQVAEVYDLIYRGRGKDFRAEAADLAELIRARKPDATSLLDVACGTGEHLRFLREHFAEVAGVELSPAMRAVATAKLPGVPVTGGDMRDFALGRTFDAVTCMFSSVAYMPTVADLRAAIARMAQHLAAGGVLVLEPWFFPEQFADGHVAGHVVRDAGRTVSRVSRSVRVDGVTRMESQYLVADDRGIEHFAQVEMITLFDESDYLQAVELAGCAAEFVADRLSDRGLVVGTKR